MTNMELVVAAIALFGDPRHNANQAFNVGTGSNKDGVCHDNPRAPVTACQASFINSG